MQRRRNGLPEYAIAALPETKRPRPEGVGAARREARGGLGLNALRRTRACHERRKGHRREMGA